MSPKILAKVTAKGQITIPAAHRKAWGLRPGDQVAFDPPEGKPVTIEPRLKRGLFERLDELPPLGLGRPMTQADIEDAITAAVTEKDKRSRGAR
jgi:AbrB family looped-hinge helix DNA binding protein